jgi:hypothetical protein
MRSDTYLHPGETLSCRGCHESKLEAAPLVSGKTPIAMQRPPSVITPEVDGANPVLYPRLVQPVLDRVCVECHQKEAKAPKLSAAVVGKFGWTESYVALKPFAWAKHGGNGALEINAETLAVKAGAGGISLLEQDNVTIGTVATLSDLTTRAGSNAAIVLQTVDGTITVTAGSDGGAGVSADGSGNILLNAQDDDATAASDLILSAAVTSEAANSRSSARTDLSRRLM